MKVLIVIAHPNPKSFNFGILEKIKEILTNRNEDYVVRDLYQLIFNPILSSIDFETFQTGKTPEDIAEEQKHISSADNIIFIYPVWWWDRPAILKGYIDRVLSYGFAYSTNPDNSINQLLKGKRAIVIQTSGGSEKLVNELNAAQQYHRSMTDGSLELCGISTKYYPIYGMFSSTPESRQREFDKLSAYL